MKKVTMYAGPADEYNTEFEVVDRASLGTDPRVFVVPLTERDEVTSALRTGTALVADLARAPVTAGVVGRGMDGGEDSAMQELFFMGEVALTLEGAITNSGPEGGPYTFVLGGSGSWLAVE